MVAELRRRPAGAERDGFVAAALRVGVLALRSAGGSLDADTIRQAGDKLVGELRETLAERARSLTSDLGTALTQYFDPRTGLMSQKLDHLVKDGGQIDQVLERTLRAHVGDESVLARTLAAHVGEGSALFRMLSPDQANGLKRQIEQALDGALRAQSAEVLRQFSLDHKDSALSRLIAEVKDSQGLLSRDLKAQVEAATREFSLDHEQSALSRLQKTVLGGQRADPQPRRVPGRRARTAGGARRAARRAALDPARRRVRGGAGAAPVGESQRLGTHQAVGATTGAIRSNKVGDHVVAWDARARAWLALVFEAKENRSCDRAPRSPRSRWPARTASRSGCCVLGADRARRARAARPPRRGHRGRVGSRGRGADPAALRLQHGARARPRPAPAASGGALRGSTRHPRGRETLSTSRTARMAGTVKNNGEKIRDGAQREQLAADVERIDEQVRAPRRAS